MKVSDKPPRHDAVISNNPFASTAKLPARGLHFQKPVTLGPFHRYVIDVMLPLDELRVRF